MIEYLFSGLFYTFLFPLIKFYQLLGRGLEVNTIYELVAIITGVLFMLMARACNKLYQNKNKVSNTIRIFFYYTVTSILLCYFLFSAYWLLMFWLTTSWLAPGDYGLPHDSNWTLYNTALL
jgi:chromate transport protein ChrA